MKNIILLRVSIIAMLFILGNCNDPVFYTISQEVAPIDPLIKGSPTNIVLFKDAMYVASSTKLFRYKGDEENKWGWDIPDSQPGGNIAQIAAVNEYLYALCYDDEKGIRKYIKRFDYKNNVWDELYADVTSDNKFQFIYSANDIVFLNAGFDNQYSVLFIDKSGILKDLSINGELSGVVFNDGAYYLCTRGQGIYYTTDPNTGAGLLRGTENIRFMGMVCLENTTKTILLIARNGELLYLRKTTDDTNASNTFVFDKVEGVAIGRMATGALAVWKDKYDPSRKLLLAGRQDRLDYTVDSGYTYGYLELVLDDTNDINGVASEAKFNEPGINAVSSVETSSDQNERYKSTIGKYPVNSIFQAPDGVLFASTPKNGVWSYRQRGKDKIWQWNAEAEKIE